MKRLSIILFQFFVGMWSAVACSCDDPGSIQTAFEHSSFVIHGKGVSMEFVSLEATMKPHKAKLIKEQLIDDKHKLQYFEADWIIKVEVEIICKFKGKFDGNRVTIFTTKTGASCGFTKFKVGQEFIIYAYPKSYSYDLFLNNNQQLTDLEKESTFWTSQCTRTKEFDIREVEELAKLKKPD